MIRRKSKPQHEPTAIDGIITAIAPVLIIGMIASLVFFLVIAFYRGDYDARLMYILGLFTVATVLIATIAIEDGRAYANAFGIPLAIAAGLAMFKFVTVSGPLGPFSSVINIGLLGVAWYLADRITFDCTAVDERDAGVQKGLLQSLRLIEDIQPVQNSSSKQAKSTQAGSTEKKRRKRRHNPGVWVLYFALLALPLFGIGQLVIPDPSARANAFKYLVAYLACTLGLLLTTSFVAMRRYVRHRGIEMPSELNRLWLGTGAIGIAAILLACLLLPLPSNRGPWLSSLPLEFVAPNGLNPSQWGWGKEGPSQQPNPSQQPQANPVNSDDKSADANGSPEPGGKGEPQASDNAPDNTKQQGSAPENKTSTDPESQSSAQNNSESQQSKNGEQQSKSDKPSSGSEQSPDSKQPNNESDNTERSNEKNSPRNQNAKANNDSEHKASEENNAERQSPHNEGGEQPTDEPKKSEKAENNGKNNQSQSSDQPTPQQPQQQTPSSSPNWLNNLSFDGFSSLLKWITILVLIAIIFFYIVTHPKEIAKLWRDLQAFFANLFGGGSSNQGVAPEDVTAEQASSPRKSFASFVDPFSSGNTKLTPRQVIEHTFSALEAWALENGRPRVNAQTAEEFATQLARQQPQVGPHARTAAQMLDRVMFAGWNPTSRDIAPLAKLWQTMRQVSRA